MSTLLHRFVNLGKISDKDRFETHIRQWIPLALIIGLVVGAVMSLFYFVIFGITEVLLSLFHPVLALLIGGLLIIALVYSGVEDTDKNGISYVISKRHQEETVPIDVGGKKFLSSAITIGSGFPVGREGPALIIGSAIASKIASWSNIPENYHHQAITLGSAASTGALFQAPFGSAIFSAEVPYKEDSDEPMLMAAFLSSVIAAVTASTLIKLLSNTINEVSLEIFHIGNASLDINFYNAVLAVILGISVGIVGRLFIELYYLFTDRLINQYEQLQRVIIGFTIGMVMIIFGIISVSNYYISEEVSPFESVVELIKDADKQLIPILVLAIIIEIIATTAIIGAGFPAGIFGPSLFIGAQTGILFAIIINTTSLLEITAWAIVAMSASHAATTKTPVASVILILEITGLPDLIIPMVLANIAAYITSGPRSLYRGQLRSRDSKIMAELKNYDQHEGFLVQQVMTSKEDVVYALPNMSLLELKQIITESSKRDFPIITSKNDYTIEGIISEDTIVQLSPEEIQSMSILDMMGKKVITVTGEMTGKEALQLMLEHDVERAPVVDKNNQLLGIVSLGDIIRGHVKLHSTADVHQDR
ncbi:MAG: chloride channel protein [Candidatus Kariarchaeaceae archaeon]